MADQDFEIFVQQFKRLTGIDLKLYKEKQMKRRLTALRDKKGYRSFSLFSQALEHDPSLLKACLDRLTINVSEFFRNPNRWEVLEKKILPRLLKEQGNRGLNIWSAACSTGEEPYSLIMLLDQITPGRPHQVLASDIDEIALEKAKQGIYHDRAVKEVPPRLLKSYFTEQNGLYYISADVKKKVRFIKQNLLADPFPTEQDLILCRNVMIYFTEEAKERLYQKFSAALRPGGVLFVGSTEQIFHPERFQFALEDTFFYRKLA